MDDSHLFVQVLASILQRQVQFTQNSVLIRKIAQCCLWTSVLVIEYEANLTNLMRPF